MGLDRMRSGDLALRVFRGDAPRLALIRALWPSAVGREIARRSEVLGLDKDVLRVRVPDARWRRALFRVQRDILVRLRRAAGPLAPARLGFVEGPVPDAPGPVPRERMEPAAAHSAEVARAAEAITDPELRARFLAAAARYLGRFQPERQTHA